MSIEDRTNLQLITTLLYMLGDRFSAIYETVFPIIETAVERFPRVDYIN
jgi:hypothetical protein